MQVSQSAVERHLRRVPRFRDASHLRWSTLSGGLSNCSVRVKADGDDFAVRLPSSATVSRPDQSLRTEWQVLIAASAAGLAPEPEWCDEGTGLMVTRYLAGPVWTSNQMRDSASWPRLAALLRKVHAIDLNLALFEPVAAAEAYWAQYSKRTQPSDRAREVWRDFSAHSAEMLAALEFSCLCHNDVMHSNIVGADPVLLDWEFAARSDPLFDLATVVVYHDFGAVQAKSLLNEYLGGHDLQAWQRLTLLCRLCRYVSWLWCLARFGRESAEASDWTAALPV